MTHVKIWIVTNTYHQNKETVSFKLQVEKSNDETLNENWHALQMNDNPSVNSIHTLIIYFNSSKTS